MNEVQADKILFEVMIQMQPLGCIITNKKL